MGTLISLVTSLSFALFSYLAALAAPLNGIELWAWRMVMTVPGVLIALAAVGKLRGYWLELKRMRTNPRRLIAYAFCAPMLAAQMWLFGWAPQAGRALEVALGYFLMPLVMVVIGRVLYKEKMSPLTAVAALVAAAAVVFEVIRTGSLGGVALFIALGYPAYFVVRRYFHTDGVSALAWEMTFALPVALWMASGSHTFLRIVTDARLLAVMLGVGVMSVLGVIGYVVAARMLPYGLFGLLSYVEPVLVTFAALALGESIAPGQIWTYGGIWAAVALLALDGVRALTTNSRFAAHPVRPWRRRRKRHFRQRLATMRVWKRRRDAGANDAGA
ncbi:chloramphenicol-sensitive protein RarD [Arcanobacterium wilhelmae]|uniref:Chloramphenicol-sensitive protein RarD n=1 Tax=Arcanobacterium wilhelmae TaxID=1803177 RepID=A0ABT9NAW2_9ACTO|nr:EamA family transporter RarD [Arcanobacterium wilhelmae]MDP9800862.1 chloramphenicol-sensitive protein RarD [Arcanobacterium wilhelmae]WFN90231.1 EamA family transporter RarD [Arcanobacterium wilhelmae]